MRSISAIMVVALILNGLVSFSRCRAQEAVVAREFLEEVTENIFSHAGEQELKELGEIGGKAAVTQILETSEQEGGETLVKKVSQYAMDDGPIALRVIGRSPAQMVDALDGLAPEIRVPAMNAVEREPQLLTNLVDQYGSGALEAAVRQPGTGEQLMKVLGNDAIPLARKLDQNQGILLARHADEIAGLPTAERAHVLAKIAQMPNVALDYLESHPTVLLTSAGVAAFLGAKDQFFGNRGLADQLFDRTLTAVQRLIDLIGIVLALALAAWFAVHIVSKWKIHRLRHAVEAERLQQPGGPLQE